MFAENKQAAMLNMEKLKNEPQGGASQRAEKAPAHPSDHGHDHGHAGHHHVEVGENGGGRLLFTLALNFIIPTAQVIGGIHAHSMALISDAVHNFSDFVALLIAYFAYLIGKKSATPANTFGYKRAEVMAALINVGILLGASGFILYEAFDRLMHPEMVLGQVVIWMAGIGIVGNGLSALVLHRDSKQSLNVRGAFLHMLGDLFTSVVVLLNGLILLYRPWYWLDPLLSVLIVAFILKNCWTIMREASGILMNATPKGFDLERIKEHLLQIPGVCGVHYMHLWNISLNSIAFSCHVEVTDQPVKSTEQLAESIRHELWHDFGIDHPVLQFETGQCGNGTLLCEISARPSGQPAAVSRHGIGD